MPQILSDSVLLDYRASQCPLWEGLTRLVDMALAIDEHLVRLIMVNWTIILSFKNRHNL
jgi:hypothetical protein